jgi:hypothetical protein
MSPVDFEWPVCAHHHLANVVVFAQVNNHVPFVHALVERTMRSRPSAHGGHSDVHMRRCRNREEHGRCRADCMAAVLDSWSVRVGL